MQRFKNSWNGTVWKAIVEFRTKEELDTYTCYADQGIGIILKRKNRNKFFNFYLLNTSSILTLPKDEFLSEVYLFGRCLIKQ